jgi:ion channel POLLUX/CASTOR
MIKERLRYRIDSIYSRGTTATVLTLGLSTLFLAMLGTIILIATRLAPAGESSYSLIEAAWVGLLSSIGQGSIGGRETVWGYRLLMLGMTFGSIFIGSFFISAMTNGMVSRVGELKKGRSKVIEEGHTIILGWSEQIFTIISELMTAYQSQSRAVIAVLGNFPKEDMEDQISAKVNLVGRTRVVCRTGDPMEMADLKIMSINTAKTIIVIEPVSEYPDADVIKTILAITKHPDRRKEPYHIVAGIRNPRNYEIAEVAGKNEVQWLVTSDVVARVIAQTSLQPGLSSVYDDLFDFANNEIYFKEEPLVCGRTFEQAVRASDQNAIIGIYTREHKVLFTPPAERVIQHGEQLIVIAQDEKAFRLDFDCEAAVHPELISLSQAAPPQPKKILILGWNWRGGKIIYELDHYVAPGSELTVVADHEKIAKAIERDCQQLDNLQVCYFPGDTDDRQILEGVLMKPYHHIILLGYSDRLPTQRADAKNLVTLLHLRDIKERDQLEFTVVTEMMDIRNYELATTAHADDYIVSDRLISLMLAQVAENNYLKDVFTELLNPESAEVYLKPASQYVQVGQPVNFHTVVEAALRRSEVAFGYRIAANVSAPDQHFGININPLKSAEVTFSNQDQIIVLAQN